MPEVSSGEAQARKRRELRARLRAVGKNGFSRNASEHTPATP